MDRNGQAHEVVSMSAKIEREKDAIRQAEQDLAERRKRLEEMEQEELTRRLDKLVRRVSIEKAIAILDYAVALRPAATIGVLEMALKDAGGKTEPVRNQAPSAGLANRSDAPTESAESKSDALMAGA